MVNPSARLLPLLALLYAAPGDAAAAALFVAALCAAISPQVRAIGLGRQRGDSSGRMVAFGMAGSRFGVAELELPTASGEGGIGALEPGSVFEIPARDASFAASPLYRELLAPLGVRPGPGLGMALERSGGRATLALLLLPAEGGWEPTPQDRELLEALAPHVLQALRLHGRLLDASTGTEALVAAFDHLVLGVILLDSAGRVSFANKSAAEILKIQPGIAEPNDEDAAARRRVLLRLYGSERPTGSQIYRHPEDGRALQIFSTPLRWPNRYGEAATRFHRAVFVGDPTRFTGDPEGIYRELYGFTAGEARLAILLASDLSLQQAAEQLGIKASTARTTLKGLFAKTQTNRQASLLRLLISGPGQLRDQRPSAAPGRRRATRRRPEAEKQGA